MSVRLAGLKLSTVGLSLLPLYSSPVEHQRYPLTITPTHRPACLFYNKLKEYGDGTYACYDPGGTRCMVCIY